MLVPKNVQYCTLNCERRQISKCLSVTEKKIPHRSSNNLQIKPGADPGFQVRGGGTHLKNCAEWRKARNFLGVFCVKNHDFTPKILIFSQF